MNLIDNLVSSRVNTQTARESLIMEMSDCQAALDKIAKIQSYIDADNVEYDKDIHIIGSLSGSNSIKGYYLQIITDRITGDIADMQLKGVEE